MSYPVKNNDAKGIVYAVDFLTKTTKNLLDNKEFEYNLKDKNVIIVGGGDTANDCCGTAARQKAKSIIELEITKEPPLDLKGLPFEFGNSYCSNQ